MNPNFNVDQIFNIGTADEIRDMVLVPRPTRHPDYDVWWERANALANILIPAIVVLRDTGAIELDAYTFSDRVRLDSVIDLLDEQDFPQIPDDIRQNIARYLHNLPGYNAEAGRNQHDKTIEKHVYVVMQFINHIGQPRQ